jgi:hypothetical protein
MLKKIVSGYHNSAEIAAIDATIARGFACGGWVLKGTSAPESKGSSAVKFSEMSTSSYPACREQNVIDSDGTVIFTRGAISEDSSLGRYVIKHSRPWIHFDVLKINEQQTLQALSEMISINRLSTLNVTGKTAHIDQRVYRTTYKVIDMLLQAD